MSVLAGERREAWLRLPRSDELRPLTRYDEVTDPVERTPTVLQPSTVRPRR
jgi:hypothetical protein